MQTSKKGTILISALWIVAILAVFAVSIGRQSAVFLKITSYNVDSRKAYFLARAGIMRALEEKALEYRSNLSLEIDALSEGWANNKELFYNHKLGEGAYTVGYEHAIKDDSDDMLFTFYGLMDEESKININTSSVDTLANLIAYFDIDISEAKEIAACIIDWRDEDDEEFTSEDEDLYGVEERYYQGLENPYSCKNEKFDSIYELIFVKGISDDILDNIAAHITVYGSGMVNINTADEIVLASVLGEDFDGLSFKILRYRNGNDEIPGTKDDRWFSNGGAIIDREEEGLVEIKNLQDPEWYANIYGIGTDEYNRITELFSGEKQEFSVNSKTYRAISVGSVKKVSIRLESVYEFDSDSNLPIIKFWYQE